VLPDVQRNASARCVAIDVVQHEPDTVEITCMCAGTNTVIEVAPGDEATLAALLIESHMHVTNATAIHCRMLFANERSENRANQPSAQGTAVVKQRARVMATTGILLLQCPDRKGVIAAVTTFIYERGGNIVHADEYQDPDLKEYFLRLEWDLADFNTKLDALANEFAPLAAEFAMTWSITTSGYKPSVAIFVSKAGHCLADLLFRHKIGELQCHIPLVISNHEDLKGLTEFYGIPFYYIPVTSAQRDQAEDAQLELLSRHKVELVVLARYMQVLSDLFVEQYPNRMINVHHSFLPAFIGARPYHRSYERGVKLVGATSHYVTTVLDEGPIIEQDIVRISHRDSLADLIRKGGDAERAVLTRAVRWHIQSRILVYGNKTVVFA
jgi:formyltetrahydrofolate deformylase